MMIDRLCTVQWKRAIRTTSLMLFMSMTVGNLSVWAQDPPPDPTPVTDAGPAANGDQPPAADPSGGQVLTQGPVHEAFATPIVHDPKDTPIVPKTPPTLIQEMPPDQKPAGHNVQWIPGYWGWDTTRNDFLWVSGIWRDPPPNSQWVPGYWNHVSDGYQWVSGSWMPMPSQQAQSAAAPQSQATYLPAPPSSLEAGPNSPQPAPNTAWNPGYWTWGQQGYVWRPGFWAAVQPNWIWIPPHYSWTPGGYLFVAGYWDLPVANRGLMFAPVYYPQPVYAEPNFLFTPSITISGSAITANLFVQPATNQYMFGDFYAQSYVSVGIVPWFSFSFSTGPPVYYDPLFSFYAVVNLRQNPRWIVDVRQTYVLRQQNIALRPPRTFIEQTRLMERNGMLTREMRAFDHREMGVALARVAAERRVEMRQVSMAERQQFRQAAVRMHQVRDERVRQERESARSGPLERPRTVNMPHSPIAAHPAGHPNANVAGHPGAHPTPHAAGRAGGSEAREEVAHRPQSIMQRSEGGRTAPAGGRPATRPGARPEPRAAGRPARAEERERREP